MPTVIPVKFRYAARELWFDPRDSGAVEADHVICRTERGLEIGLATADAMEVSYHKLRSTCGDAQLKPIERVASEADLARADELARRGEAAMPTFRRLIDSLGLDMKPVGVEWLFGAEKVVCYFSAEERVDFRQLVRELARELHERVDMRQIGVREEAAVVGGYAHCGQELCCARFGRQFEPVSIRMAKEQDLPLNSTKISGACGRLMCCLRYEFEAYRDFKGRAPKRNAVIETPLGKAKIVEYDTPKEQVSLRLENGKQVRVALADMEASDAARRRAEELKCPCRPDTVSRAALERLASPEVKLALAELDREMGVAVEDGFSSDDIFVSTRPGRRRRRSQGASAAGGPGGGGDARAEEGAQGSTRRSRRRRKRRSPGEGASAEGASQAQARRASGQGGEAAKDDAQQPSRRRRRRHHSSGKGAADATGAQASTDVASQQPRARRRPGDKGGAQGAGGQPSAATPDDAQGGTASRRRRRRHRGGRGRGKGDAAEGGSGE